MKIKMNKNLLKMIFWVATIGFITSFIAVFLEKSFPEYKYCIGYIKGWLIGSTSVYIGFHYGLKEGE